MANNETRNLVATAEGTHLRSRDDIVIVLSSTADQQTQTSTSSSTSASSSMPSPLRRNNIDKLALALVNLNLDNLESRLAELIHLNRKGLLPAESRAKLEALLSKFLIREGLVALEGDNYGVLLKQLFDIDLQTFFNLALTCKTTFEKAKVLMKDVNNPHLRFCLSQHLLRNLECKHLTTVALEAPLPVGAAAATNFYESPTTYKCGTMVTIDYFSNQVGIFICDNCANPRQKALIASYNQQYGVITYHIVYRVGPNGSNHYRYQCFGATIPVQVPPGTPCHCGHLIL
jgi:hypothetical protein